MHSTAEIVVAQLRAQGIDTLYCLPGVQNDDFFDALYDARDIYPLHCRHEQGAAFMALGAQMVSGRAQAFCAPPGPGFLNAGAALSVAYAANAKVLALTGQIPKDAIGRGFGMLHETPDQLGIMRRLTKWAGTINGATDAQRKVRRAFAEMLNGRPRPAALQCPMDVWSERAAIKINPAAVKAAAALPDEGLIKKAAILLARAEAPLMIVGGGAQDAGEETPAIAEMLAAPVCAFRAGHGVIDGRHPLSVGAPLGRELWRNADAVLAVGTRLEQLRTWGGGAAPVVRIDIDKDETARHDKRRRDVAICADAGLALAALGDALQPRIRRGPRRRRLAEIKKQKARALKRVAAVLVPQFAFLRAIREALDDDGVFVDEMTQIAYAARFAFPTYRPRRFLSTGYQGALGWGYAAALGAKAARRDLQVVSVCGDGGFLYTAAELATAIRHKLGAVAVVFNDRAFGNVKLFQKERYRARYIASDLTNPDFVALARSFGAAGIRARTPAALAAALKKTLAADKPAVIEVPCREMPSPWQFIPSSVPPAAGGKV